MVRVHLTVPRQNAFGAVLPPRKVACGVRIEGRKITHTLDASRVTCRICASTSLYRARAQQQQRETTEKPRERRPVRPAPASWPASIKFAGGAHDRPTTARPGLYRLRSGQVVECRFHSFGRFSWRSLFPVNREDLR